MAMGRYLLYIAYLGRNFSGLQRQGNKEGITTIVGALEDALKYLSPANDINVVTSSRTDRGVHALCNTVHVDLTHSDEGSEICPDDVTWIVNNNMQMCKHDIRVLQTLRVPDDFHSRFNAKSRTYVYRSATTRKEGRGWVLPYSPFEYMTAYLNYKKPVDVDLVRRAAELLSGTHDFSAFSKARRLAETPWVNPVKTMEVEVAEGRPFMGHHLPEICNTSILNLEFIFKSNSFLYRQVRKMSAVMLAVGGGWLDLDLVRRMLDEPTVNHVTMTSIYNIPSYGLYLKEVEYDPEDLIYPPVEGRSDPHSSKPPDDCVRPPGDATVGREPETIYSNVNGHQGHS